MKLIGIFIFVFLVLALCIYSRRIDGFTDPIPRFSKPVPVIPEKPHPAMNSNGGLVHIS
jgi:hypothetical protein